jgi:hypothetical protein
MNTKFWSDTLKREILEGRRIHGRIIWKLISEKQGVSIWSEFNWLMVGSSSELL